jgi:hypothetical protein
LSIRLDNVPTIVVTKPGHGMKASPSATTSTSLRHITTTTTTTTTTTIAADTGKDPLESSTSRAVYGEEEAILVSQQEKSVRIGRNYSAESLYGYELTSSGMITSSKANLQENNQSQHISSRNSDQKVCTDRRVVLSSSSSSSRPVSAGSVVYMKRESHTSLSRESLGHNGMQNGNNSASHVKFHSIDVSRSRENLIVEGGGLGTSYSTEKM